MKHVKKYFSDYFLYLYCRFLLRDKFHVTTPMSYKMQQKLGVNAWTFHYVHYYKKKTMFNFICALIYRRREYIILILTWYFHVISRYMVLIDRQQCNPIRIELFHLKYGTLILNLYQYYTSILHYYCYWIKIDDIQNNLSRSWSTITSV